MISEELQIIQLGIIGLLSLVTLYQIQMLKSVIKERNSLRERISKIEHENDEIMNIKRTNLVEIKNEIDKLTIKAKYISEDQIELNKEYEYLQKRNRDLESNILKIEERSRNQKDV